MFYDELMTTTAHSSPDSVSNLTRGKASLRRQSGIPGLRHLRRDEAAVDLAWRTRDGTGPDCLLRDPCEPPNEAHYAARSRPIPRHERHISISRATAAYPSIRRSDRRSASPGRTALVLDVLRDRSPGAGVVGIFFQIAAQA